MPLSALVPRSGAGYLRRIPHPDRPMPLPACRISPPEWALQAVSCPPPHAESDWAPILQSRTGFHATAAAILATDGAVACHDETVRGRVNAARRGRPTRACACTGTRQRHRARPRADHGAVPQQPTLLDLSSTAGRQFLRTRQSHHLPPACTGAFGDAPLETVQLVPKAARSGGWPGHAAHRPLSA
jgi:hypothetical protein